MRIVALALADLDHHLFDALHAILLLDQVDVLAIQGKGDGGLRQYDLVLLGRQQNAGAGKHAGAQLAVVVGDVRLHLDQAALVVDGRFDGADVALELAMRVGIHVDQDVLIQANAGDIGLRHGEAQAHHAGVFQPDDIGTRLQVLTEEDVAQADYAGKRCAHFAAGDGRFQTLDIGLEGAVGRLGVVQLVAGDGSLGEQVLIAIELGLGRRQLGHGGAQVGLLDAGIQAQQQLIRLDGITRLEGDAVDGAGLLGRQGYPLVGFDETDGLDGRHPVAGLHLVGGDRKLGLRHVGHVVGYHLLLEQVEANHAAEQGQRDEQHDAHPLFHELSLLRYECNV